jgi:hypothetical protein
MSGSSSLNMVSESEPLPDLTFQIPSENPRDYPMIAQLEQSAAGSESTPDSSAKAPHENQSLEASQTILNVRSDPAPNTLNEQHRHQTDCPAHTDTKTLREPRPCVTGPEDSLASMTGTSQIRANESAKKSSNYADPCRHPSDVCCDRQPFADQRSSVSPPTPGPIADEPSTRPGSDSNESMLHRWYAQPPSEEPYTPIKGGFFSRTTRSSP